MGRIAGLAPEETRRRLLDAAAKVFAERGFEGARISEIAAEAGVTPGAIYNHYKSKADLLLAAIQTQSDHEIASVLGGDEEVGVLDLLSLSGAALDTRRGRRRGSLLVEAIVASRRDPKVARVLSKAVGGREDVFADLVAMGQASGQVDGDVDPQAVARLCLMLGLGSLLVGALDLPPTDQSAWSQLIARLVDGFRTEEKSA